MTSEQIITGFELQVDDTTELSSTEELAVLNRIYRKILSDRAWEFLKKSHTTTTSSSVPYVSLPSDFQYLTQNNNYTQNGYEASGPVVFVGSTYTPYRVVSWSDRRQYRDQEGYCYIDIVNSRLYFTKQPSSALSIEFDYAYMPSDLTLSDTPVFPERFHDMLIYGMATDDSIIQQSDKAKSYAQENNAKYKAVFDSMCLWNANLIQQ